MLDLVGNPKDRFSHNEAHLTCVRSCFSLVCLICCFPSTVNSPVILTTLFPGKLPRGRLTELSAHSFPNKHVIQNNFAPLIFFLFCSKTEDCGHLNEAVLTSIKNLCFRAKIFTTVNPSFTTIKVEFEGVLNSLLHRHNGIMTLTNKNSYSPF